MNEFVNQFQLGVAKVTIINIGYLAFDLAASFDISEAEWSPQYDTIFKEPLHLPVQSTLIEMPDTTILIDPSLYDIRPSSRFAIDGYEPPAGLSARLAELGVTPEQIEHVIITHLHFDHFNGTTVKNGDIYEPAYPKARYYIGRADWESEDTQKGLQKSSGLAARTLGVLQQADLVDLVEGTYPVTPDIQCIATPGETPGHQMVRIESEGNILYCVGDLVHHTVEFEQPSWAVKWCDTQAIKISREMVIETALAEDALIFATHISTIGQLQRNNGKLVWRS